MFYKTHRCEYAYLEQVPFIIDTPRIKHSYYFLTRKKKERGKCSLSSPTLLHTSTKRNYCIFYTYSFFISFLKYAIFNNVSKFRSILVWYVDFHCTYTKYCVGHMQKSISISCKYHISFARTVIFHFIEINIGMLLHMLHNILFCCKLRDLILKTFSFLCKSWE